MLHRRGLSFLPGRAVGLAAGSWDENRIHKDNGKPLGVRARSAPPSHPRWDRRKRLNEKRPPIIIPVCPALKFNASTKTEIWVVERFWAVQLVTIYGSDDKRQMMEAAEPVLEARAIGKLCAI